MRIVILISGLFSGATAFRGSFQKPFSVTFLQAKKKGTQAKSSGGGFGAVKPKQKAQADYSVFPRLEPDVSKTLDPAPSDWAAAPGPLPQEIYDRLEQIYGFGGFNGAAERPLSMNELIQSPQQNDLSDILSSKPTSESLALDDILPSSGGTERKTSNVDLSIDSLPQFNDFRILHIDPLVIAVDDFFTSEECDNYVSQSTSGAMKSRSPTVGKDSSAKAQRTSTTYYHHFEAVPELMAKASRLFGLDSIERWEEPQTVRYRKTEKFTWHLDALGPNENLPELGGQRLATLIVYLTDLQEEHGGATMFRDLGEDGKPLAVQPRKGTALLFFPAAGAIPNTPFDVRTLHCGEAVSKDSKQDKWISQLWLRQGAYTPTAPPGNSHEEASNSIAEFCSGHS